MKAISSAISDGKTSKNNELNQTVTLMKFLLRPKKKMCVYCFPAFPIISSDPKIFSYEGGPQSNANTSKTL